MAGSQSLPLSQVFLQSPQALPLAVGVAAAVAVAVLWLYTGQVRAAGGAVGRWLLPWLRVAALLALAAALLKPVLLRPRSAAERGTVLVLVDRSRSMATVDNARTPAQLVALADALGRLPPGASRVDVAPGLKLELGRLRALADAATGARDDLYFARVSGVGAEEARRRADAATVAFASAAEALAARAAEVKDDGLRQALAALVPAASATAPAPVAEVRGAWAADVRARIDAAAAAADAAQRAADEQLYAASEPVRQACAELARLPRIALAEQALLRPGAGLVPQVAAGVPVSAYAVAGDVSPLDLRAGGGGATTRPALGVEPDGRRSDLASAVAEALRLRGGGEGIAGPVGAVVLLSDGRQVGAAGALAAGLSGQPSGPPVFAVAAAPADAVRDLAFASVEFPAAVFAGESITVTATVRALGIAGTTATVRLKSGGDAEQVRQVVIPSPSAASDAPPPVPAVAEFRLKLDQPGAQEFVLSIDPLPDEATADNNTARRWVKVTPQKMRVLAVAGSPTWEFQYLRNALGRSAEVRLESTILPPTDAPKLAVSVKEIAEQDVLILSDVPAAALSDDQWAAVYMLASRGGSVVLMAGEAHLPSEYARRPQLSALLPYDPDRVEPAWRVSPGEEPSFRFAPTPDGRMLRLADDGGADRWPGLPGFYRFLPIPVSDLRANIKPLLVEVESRAAGGEAGRPNPHSVLTQMRLGLGRVFFFGAQETWRWRLKSGERDHDRFWLQLVRYAAEEPYAARTASAALDVERVAIEPGDTVGVRVRLFDDTARAEDYSVNVVRADGAVVARRDVTASSTSAPGTGRYSVELPPLDEGEYRVRLVGPKPAPAVTDPAGLTQPAAAAAAAAAPQPPEAPLKVAATSEAELSDLSPDHALLRRLAESSGGEFLTLDQIGQLPDRLAAVTARRTRLVEHPLWHSPLLFAFVVACFGAEWALRKRVGLA